MEYNVIYSPLEDTSGDALVVYVKQDQRPNVVKRLDKLLDGGLTEVMDSEFKGKLNQASVIHTLGKIKAKRILLVGLGRKKEFTLDSLRQASGKAARIASGSGLTSFSVLFPDGIDLVDGAQAIVEGVSLGSYSFRRYKKKEDDEDDFKEITSVTLVTENNKKIKKIDKGVKLGGVVSNAVNLARDLTNDPVTANEIVREYTESSRKNKLKITILDEKGLKEEKLNAILAVAKGSAQPARLIVLEHKPARKRGTIVLVGKGITFDSGGISIKPGSGMDKMKYDKAGAIAVLSVMQAISQLKIPLHVVALAPLVENMPDGRALKPGDIIESAAGKTIEVLNTDAEGRLILSDALHYAKKFKPNAVIDLATLTGACSIALGSEAAGLMGNDSKLVNKINTAAKKTGERVWELPLWKKYRELIKSKVADLRNIGSKKGEAGTIVGGMFLREFTDYSWAHLDIAGVAWIDKDDSSRVSGATGYGVRLLVQLLRDWRGRE